MRGDLHNLFGLNAGKPLAEMGLEIPHQHLRCSCVLTDSSAPLALELLKKNG
jgi:hypothetical protein